MSRNCLVITVPILGLLAVSAPAISEQQRDARRAPRATVVSPVDLNTASIAELETLPGVGRRTAERIVEYRQKHGGFKKIEELMNVQGIGEKSFLKLKDLITVTPPKVKDVPSTPDQ